MNTAEPIREQQELENFKNYYICKEPNIRNYTLLCLGLNTALRISDILRLKWWDVYDFELDKFRGHIQLSEQKTGKDSRIYMNKNVVGALERYKRLLQREDEILYKQYIFEGYNGKQLSRVQAWRIIRKAAEECNLSGVISPHSLRKTFGYQAWQQGIQPVMLMEIYNHSSFAITKRYLGIQQDDRDEVFRNICL